MTFNVKPAQPEPGRILMALAGPQASGKTTSALRLATGITQKTGGRIVLIDTENKRSLKYSAHFKFNVIEFAPPFSPLRYLEAIEAAQKAGYGAGDVLIIDSMTHEHDGPGGVLEMHEEFLEKRCGSDYGKREKLKFTAWIKPKSDRNRVIQMGLARSPMHVILCFRAKEKVAMVKGDNGKTEVINDGWQPIGGDEYFFEMDITMMLPLGAQGRPDWSQKAGRINEYGDNTLRSAIKSFPQISEEMGAKIAEITGGSFGSAKKNDDSARTSSTQSVQVDPIKEAAYKIRSHINNAPDAQSLYDIINVDFADVIAQIKESSPTAYDFLMKEYKLKESSFNSQ